MPIERDARRDQHVIRVQRLAGVARLKQAKQAAGHVFAQRRQAVQVVAFVQRAQAVLLKQFGVQQLLLVRGHSQPYR